MKIQDTDVFWNSSSIEMVKLNGEWYCLDGWNGELFTECWKYKDRRGFDRADDETYFIRPVYEEVSDDDFEIVGYKFEY